MAQAQIVNMQAEMKNKRICRFCLSQNEPLTNIYSRKSSSLLREQLIMTYASVKVFTNDGMPNTVCETCRVFIEHNYLFKQMCQKADTCLKLCPLTGAWPQSLDIPQMSEEFILRHYPNLCRKPQTDSIAPRLKISALDPSAVESTSGVTQEPQANPSGIKMLNKISNIYQFKIMLMGSNPQIWRRIQVPAKYSFWDLHVAIQTAMGWGNYHLHKFSITNPETGESDEIGEPYPACPDTIPGKTTKIAKYFVSSYDTAAYEYEYGDCWEHVVILEKVLPAIAGMRYPQCIEGEMACPPEDCRGLFGYCRFVRIMRNPHHNGCAEPKDWLEENGNNFNPVVFDPKSVKFYDSEEL